MAEPDGAHPGAVAAFARDALPSVFHGAAEHSALGRFGLDNGGNCGRNVWPGERVSRRSPGPFAPVDDVTSARRPCIGHDGELLMNKALIKGKRTAPADEPQDEFYVSGTR